MLDQMCAAGVEPRLRSYVGLVEAFAARGNLAALQDLFEHMRTRGVVPSQAEYAHLLRCLRRQDLGRVWVSGPGFSPQPLWVTSRVCAGSPSLAG